MVELQNMAQFEDMLMEALEKGNLEEIERVITPKALLTCKSNVLFLAMKASFKLRCLADQEGPSRDDIVKLASSVEELTTHLLSPLKEDKHLRESFGDEIDTVMETAIELEQRKFFVDPVIDSEISQKWHGRFLSEIQPWKRLLLNIFCLLDLVLFPIFFAVLYGYHVCTGRCYNDIYEKYKRYFKTPYFVFVRDTLSYLTLLALHVAFCLAPSTLQFSGVEWAILVFVTGRLLVEGKQISKLKAHIDRQATLSTKSQNFPEKKLNPLTKTVGRYLSDRGNAMDVISLCVYLATFILRIATWSISDEITNNRALVISGYLYGFNTMILTYRAIGQLIDTSKRTGTIQIALVHILFDIIAIFGLFMATILAFSASITKIYMAEKSFIRRNIAKDLVCEGSGISCWWAIFTHLGWSLLGIPDFSFLVSQDYSSEALARIFYAAFLIMGVVLLVNMLIALLTITYQRVEDNSLMEWSFKKAITVQTYTEYDPIPVPLNIVSSLFIGVQRLRRINRCRREGEEDESTESHDQTTLFMIVDGLRRKYLRKYGFSFPPTDEEKKLEVAYETENIRQMVNQIAQRTFEGHGHDSGSLHTGPQEWISSNGIRLQGCLLTCEGTEECENCPNKRPADRHVYGARYLSPFTPEIPHFEVLIQETEDVTWLEVGIVSDDSADTHYMPGRKIESIGYRPNDGKISFDGNSLETDCIARRGDLIGYTVMLEEARQQKASLREQTNDEVENAKVKVLITLNGSRITQEEISMCYTPGKHLYPFIGMKEKGIKVLAKMRARSNLNKSSLQLSQLTQRESMETKLDTVLQKLAEIDKITKQCSRDVELLRSEFGAYRDQKITDT